MDVNLNLSTLDRKCDGLIKSAFHEDQNEEMYWAT